MINMTAVLAREDAYEAWTRSHTDDRGNVTSDLSDPPPQLARWAAYHQACAPPDGNDYWFGLERCQSGDDLLMWTLHLLEKTWLPQTDWEHFAAEVARASGIADP